MSATDSYFTVPLSILRSGRSELEVLESCLSVGIVNAGIGYEQHYGLEDFTEVLNKARKESKASAAAGDFPNLYRGNKRHLSCAVVGAHIVGVSGGDRAADVGRWKELHRQGEVFFRIKSGWLWNALNDARRNAERDGTRDLPPLSFREFRIIAAILSAKINRQNFTFLGWESIQARGCGYKSKVDFAAGRENLPEHCQPLSRQMVRDTMSNLEALGFFVRLRYAAGGRGGWTAYSFRHPTRERLAEAVGTWREEGRAFAIRVAANREKDRELSAAIQAGTKSEPTENQHKEGNCEKEPSQNQHKEDEKQVRNQVENQVRNQHKEKGLNEKGSKESFEFCPDIWDQLKT